ncbi:MAG: helix-turn-helix domain-containing protein [Alphaproteobacteria bacterium]|nr:helix-turn-helix domain-containing protein [Alphaproteobacteria bacterium]
MNKQEKQIESFTLLASHECALAQAIKLIGDKWTLLILREALYGVCRFSQMQKDTGMPRTVLSNRLNCLLTQGLMTKVPYRDPGKRTRYEYKLTSRGSKLIISFSALMEWGEQMQPDDNRPRINLYHACSGERVRVSFVTESGQSVNPRDKIRIRISRKTCSQQS